MLFYLQMYIVLYKLSLHNRSTLNLKNKMLDLIDNMILYMYYIYIYIIYNYIFKILEKIW